MFLVVGLVGLGFSTTIKSVAEKSFDVKKNYNCYFKSTGNEMCIFYLPWELKT